MIIPASLEPRASLKNYGGSTLEYLKYGCAGKGKKR